MPKGFPNKLAKGLPRTPKAPTYRPTTADLTRLAGIVAVNPAPHNPAAILRQAAPNYPGTDDSASVAFSRWAQNPLVRDLVVKLRSRGVLTAAQIAERYGATVDHAAAELSRIAFAQLRDVVDVVSELDEATGSFRTRVTIRDWSLVSDDTHRAIAKVKQRVDGTVEVELYDKLAALRDLARLRGWVADRPVEQGNTVQLVIQR